MKKKVLLISPVKFWLKNSGAHCRTFALANHVGQYTDLSVVVPKPMEARDRVQLSEQHINFQVVPLGKQQLQDRAAYLERFYHYVLKSPPEFCIIEFHKLSFLTDLISGPVKFILDCHDLLSARAKSFKNYGQDHDGVSFEEEMRLFRKYDRVLMIQEEEYRRVKAYLKDDTAMLVPHPAVFRQQVLRRRADSVGFMASDYIPNVEGLRWFLREVWPRVDKQGMELHVYGSVQRSFTGESFERVVFHGFVEDLDAIFSSIDVMINPVLFGAGLKIKNVESMGNGIPLICSPHAAGGLRDAAGEAFLVAGEADGFAAQLEDLMQDYEKRRTLGNRAYAYIREHFSPEKCFGPLVEFICGSVPAA